MIGAERWTRILTVLGMVGALSACGTGRDAPAVPPTTAAADNRLTTPSGSPPPRYDVTGLDLCARTDLRVLDDLHLTLKRKNPEPGTWQGPACLFEMQTPSGHTADLLVQAQAPESRDEAMRIYEVAREVRNMQPAAPVDGVGDEAAAFTRRSHPGFEYGEYLICARYGNLVLKVWLAVGGKTLVPTSTLAPKALSVLTATYNQVTAG